MNAEIPEICLSSSEVGGARGSYLEAIHKEHEGSHIWDYLGYDQEGDLWINDVRVMDLVQYGTPLEIVDTRIIERRAKEWVERTERIAREVGYRGGFKYFYAAKANFSPEFTATAYRAGWHAETTSTQDLINIEELTEEGLFDKENHEIVCNGFFLPQEQFGAPQEIKEIKSNGVVFETGGSVDYAGEMDYLSRIINMHDKGYHITPIIYGLDELEQLLGKMRGMDIGLRLKFGKITNDRDLAMLRSRFGMSFEEADAAATIADSKDNELRLTMIHAMVGAAENIPIDVLNSSLLFAADKYFGLRANHPTLQYLNIGGGIPPMSETYDHDELLRRFLSGVQGRARMANLPEPTIVFELGSYIASEAAFDVAKIVHTKQNNVDANGNPETWAIGDTSLVATIPDVWFLPGKRFTILAANNANGPSKKVLGSDLTCDSGSVYPDEITIPDSTQNTYLVICGTGAYQNVLSGEGGTHHCGLYESAKWKILERNGVTHSHFIDRQTWKDSMKLLRYTRQGLRHLR